MSGFEQAFLFGFEPTPAPEPEATEVKRSARFGDPDEAGRPRLRWVLHRWWGDGGNDRRVCWIMLNPSLADDAREDPTLHVILHFTRAWGYDGLSVVNLYPFISPDPKACRAWAEAGLGAREALAENLDVVARVAGRADLVMAAWGAGAWDAGWVAHVLAHLRAEIADFAPHCLGVTADGAPKHPLARGLNRIPRDMKPEPWGMAA